MNNLPPASSAPDMPQPSIAQPVVLVVDDSATNRVVLEKQLHKLGCRVLSAHDGSSGLQAIGQGGIDLVLLDCQMPDISGYEVARQVRAQAAGIQARHLPVIALSGNTDAAHRQLCIDSGMDDVLLKPIAVVQLRRLLMQWCAAQEGSPADMGNAVLASDLGTQLHSLYRVTSLTDFAALAQCAGTGDLFLLARLVHRMKGAALAVGASHIVATLEQIETMSVPGSNTSAEQLTMALKALRQQLDADRY